jgi:hypothetical protein
VYFALSELWVIATSGFESNSFTKSGLAIETTPNVGKQGYQKSYNEPIL